MSYSKNLHQGLFKPKNPEKYVGNAENIVYRSGWEKLFMKHLDENPNVEAWQSEEFAIPYLSPLDGSIHRYFPDFLVRIKKPDGSKETLVVEIKPCDQTSPPEKGKKKTRTFMNEVARWGVNEAKWNAAEGYCKDRGWKFRILTEHELGIE